MRPVVLLFAASLAVAAPPKPTAVLATVNGDAITVQDLVDQFTKRHGGHAKFLGGDMEARTFLNILIEERLFIQEAYNIGLDQDPRVDEAVTEFERGKTSALLVRTEIDDKSNPSPAEVRATWEKSLNFFMQVRQIAVDTKQDAEEIRAAILRGADVDALARGCSRADSRVRGGLIRVNWGQFGEEWERAVFPLAPGEVSPVITTPSGFEVVLVEDRIDSARPPFEKVASQIENVLRLRRLEERKHAFSEELWAKYHVALQGNVATWDGGGRMTLDEHLSKDDLRATVNGPLVELEAKARKLAATPEIARAVAKYRETVMESLLFRQHILKDVTLTDAEARAYYDAHQGEFQAPEERHVAHILLASEGEAKAVREKLLAGAEFGQVARKQSRDAGTALFDGKLGWITPDKVPPDFKQVLTLAAGEVSKPLRSSHGWHLVKVDEIKPMRQLPFDQVQPQLRKRALEAKERAVQTTWLAKLRVPAKIKLDDAAIKRFVQANEFDANAAAPQHGMR